MKIAVKRTSRAGELPAHWDGWLAERYGDHCVQISVSTTLKLKSAVKDVARFRLGYVPQEIEVLAAKLPLPPMGVTDYDFCFGYHADEADVPGAKDTDPYLKEYIRDNPQDWEVVQKAIGLQRSLGRHACLPAGEKIQTMGNGSVPIEQCDGESVYTGQGVRERKRGTFSPNGTARLLPQGEREVVEYKLANGRSLRCTPDHKLLTTEGWVEAHICFEKQLELVESGARIKLTKEHAEAYASTRGGRLIRWGGAGKELSTWGCSKGHEWTGKAARMLNNEHWCRMCSHQYRFQATKKYVPIKRSASKCLNTYQRYDVKKGLDTDLTVEDVVLAKQSPCHYCSRAATGMERIDNDKGHIKSNCVPACLRCNWMRGRWISHSTMEHVGKVLKEVDP